MVLRTDLGSLMRLHRMRTATNSDSAATNGSHLQEVQDFGTNPGALRMLAYVPAGLRPDAPLVVALHGCTQTAGAYDVGCGWSDMAERGGFALLMPEQRRSNNAHLCFNWFDAEDIGRDRGEVLSIRQMVDHMLQEHGLDRKRVFISGLSAGGAMTSAMLAAYPEIFAAGAVIAGLPAGSAQGVVEALSVMSRPASLPARARGDAVRQMSRHQGPWPRVAVWHGDQDTTVQFGNAEETVKQWLDLHGMVDGAARLESDGPRHSAELWAGADGIVRVALHRVAGLGHGVPLAPGTEPRHCGRAGPYLIDTGLSSTHAILDFWGLKTDGGAVQRQETGVAARQFAATETAPAEKGPVAVINNALRAAGLLK